MYYLHKLNCRICLSPNGEIIEAREMMFVMRHIYKYLECANCGCLQIDSYPESMDKYYPADYYFYDNNYEGVFFQIVLRKKY